MTAGRMLSINRTDAARLSMVLSIPAILAAGGYQTFVTGQRGELGAQPPCALLGRWLGLRFR